MHTNLWCGSSNNFSLRSKELSVELDENRVADHILAPFVCHISMFCISSCPVFFVSLAQLAPSSYVSRWQTLDLWLLPSVKSCVSYATKIFAALQEWTHQAAPVCVCSVIALSEAYFLTTAWNNDLMAHVWDCQTCSVVVWICRLHQRVNRRQRQMWSRTQLNLVKSLQFRCVVQCQNPRMRSPSFFALQMHIREQLLKLSAVGRTVRTELLGEGGDTLCIWKTNKKKA